MGRGDGCCRLALILGYAVWTVIAASGYWLADVSGLHEVFLSL